MMRMVKKILFLTGCFCCLWIRQAENVAVRLDNPLYAALQATGAEVEQAELLGQSFFALQRADDSGLVEMVREAAGKLGFAAEIERRRSAKRAEAILSCTDGAMQAVIYAKRDLTGEAKASNAELTIRLIKKGAEEKEVAALKEKMLAVLRKKTSEPMIYTCLKGYVDGRLRKDEWENCIRDAFAAAGALPRSRFSNAYYANGTGWSPLIGEYLRVGKENVNFHVAVRYHDFDRRTYITVGSPIITADY